METNMYHLRLLLLAAIALVAVPTMCGADECSLDPFIEKDVCPGEYCRFGQSFVSLQNQDTYDKPNGAKTGILKKGSKVKSLTGDVYSIPLKVQRIPRRGKVYKDGGWVPAPEPDLFADQKLDISYGESFFVIRYGAEGYWMACHNGKIISVPEIWDWEKFTPKNTWWIQLKTDTGQKVWVKAEPYQEFRSAFRCLGPDCDKW
jgi:hypothetical protein